MKYRGFALTTLALPVVVALGCILCLSSCVAERGQRQLQLSDFDFLELGMSLEEITDRLGKPDRDVGSGIFLIQYDLPDGRTVRLVFVNPDELLGAQVQEKDGTWMDLFEEQN